MAPPTKVTRARLLDLRDALERGATLREAAAFADISVRTLHRWIKRGFRGEGHALYAVARQIVHDARRLNGTRLVRTKNGLALRRRPVLRPNAKTLLRLLKEWAESPRDG